MIEIHGAERAGFKRLGGTVFNSRYPDQNNEELKEVWEKLEIISLGTLSVGFQYLYYLAGAFSPAYDMEGKLGQKPPEIRFRRHDSGIVEVLFPAYKSIVHRGNTRPAVLGVWARETQPELEALIGRLLSAPQG